MTSSPIPRHPRLPPNVNPVGFSSRRLHWDATQNHLIDTARGSAFCRTCLHQTGLEALPLEPGDDVMYPYVCPRHGHLLVTMVDQEESQEGIPNE